MPVDRHLTVTEMTDFSAGLWEGNDWLMPAGAAQVMTDCYPQVGGGLRAFFRGTPMSASGITAPSEERVVGLFSRGGVPLRSGAAGDGTDRYLATFGANVGGSLRPRLYRMDGSNGETTWTRVYLTSGTTEWDGTGSATYGGGPQKIVFRYFQLSDGTEYVILSILAGISNDGNGDGIYRLAYADLSGSQFGVELTTSVVGATRPAGPLAIHQARIMVVGGTTENVLVWSDPGSLTFGAASELPVEPNQNLPAIVALHPTPPSALLVVKEGAPMVNIHGDITDPTVYQLAEGIPPSSSGRQDLGATPEGAVFIAMDGHVYRTTGETIDDLSPQLGGFNQQGDAVSPGDTNYLPDFLFAPNGYVLHWPTKSWFKQTVMAGAFHTVDRYTRKIWGPVGTGASFALTEISPSPDTSRLNTFTWKSAPLRSPDGRQLEIREVEVFCKTYDAEATIAVTVNGTTVTRTLASAARQDTSALFVERGEVLDVQVVSTAGNSANEAPSIEAVRVKTRSGHQTY